MLESAVQAVNDHGRTSTSVLLKSFEDFLRQVNGCLNVYANYIDLNMNQPVT